MKGAVDQADLQLILEWTASLRAMGLTVNNITNRRRAVTRFARWANVTLLTASSAEVEAFMGDQVPEGRKQRYRLTAPLLDFYEWVVMEGLLEDPPVRRDRFRKRRGRLYRDADDMAVLLEGYKVAQERRSLSSDTIASRQGGLRLFAEYMAPRSIVSASAEDIEQHLDARHLGARARYRAVSDLHMFFRWAIKAGHALHDPTEEIDRPRLPRLLPRPINDADLAVAMAAAEPVMAAWLALAAYAGLRCKEIAALHTADVVDHASPAVLIVKGKGDKDRVVPMHPDVTAALRRLAPARGGYFFTRTNGRPIGANVVSTEGGHFLHDLGIQATMHQLRHWFGTRVYGNTLDLRLTQELLGHSSVTTTAGYAAFTPTKAAEAVSSLSLTTP